MIAFAAFTWVHIPKCAGNSISHALSGLPGVRRAILAHVPWTAAEQPNAPVLAFVRSPWDYYSSLYNHLRLEPLFASRGFNGDFATAVKAAIAQHASMSQQLEFLAGWNAPPAGGLTLLRVEDGVERQLNRYLFEHDMPPISITARLNARPHNPPQWTHELISAVQAADGDVLDAFDYPLEPT